MINGGYYLKARRIQDSEIAHAPPHVREIWDWLLKECNHKDKIVHGTLIRRGQCLRTYRDIQHGLQWHIGWRRKRYSKWQCEGAMKKLRRWKMITTQKTTRGLLITVLNYGYYQNPANYESHNGSHNESHSLPQTRHTINKNDKNDKKKDITINSNMDKSPARRKPNPDLQSVIEYAHSKRFALQGSQGRQRQAAWNLMRRKNEAGKPLGAGGVKQLIDLAVACQGEQYAPMVNDFFTLGKRWQDLLSYVAKHHSKKGRIG